MVLRHVFQHAEGGGVCGMRGLPCGIPCGMLSCGMPCDLGISKSWQLLCVNVRLGALHQICRARLSANDLHFIDRLFKYGLQSLPCATGSTDTYQASGITQN